MTKHLFKPLPFGLTLALAACGTGPSPASQAPTPQASAPPKLQATALPDTAVACLYEHTNYAGASICFGSDSAPNGVLNQPWIGGTWNDRVSSVQLRPGALLDLYGDINYGGRSLRVSADASNLTGLNFNDVASSFKLSRPSGKIVGGYYPWWVGSPIRLRNIDPNYNLIYLFAATPAPGDTSGAVRWQAPADVNGTQTNWLSDLQYARTVQGRRVILSVGGAGFGMKFPNRTTSTNFVNSIDALYNQWKGFDGLDFNTFEGSNAPDTAEMIWIAQELKRRHPGFLISAPPAPWNTVDQQFCRDMLSAGALDYCAPQYYDGPNLADPNWILPNVDTWMRLLGPEHVVIGVGVDPQTSNYETVDVAMNVWKQIKAKYPQVRGAFNWQIDSDARQGYPFARQVGPLVR